LRHIDADNFVPLIDIIHLLGVAFIAFYLAKIMENKETSSV